MKIDAVLHQFHCDHGFAPDTGERPKTVGVFVGCLLVPLPNIDARRIYLKFHDLHHILTDAGVGRVGEAEVSAWELGTGTFKRPSLMVMNLIAFSTGIVLAPRKMFRSFLRGCRSKNLYGEKIRRQIESGELADFDVLKKQILEVRPKVPWLALRVLEFLFYILASLLIHAIIVIPSLSLRGITKLLNVRGPIKRINVKKW